MKKKSNATTRKAGPGIPQLRWQKTKSGDYGYAVFNGQERRFGRRDDPNTQTRFDAYLAQWLARGRKPASQPRT